GLHDHHAGRRKPDNGKGWWHGFRFPSSAFRCMSIRVGLGYDSHRFRPPGPLILGGIRIPFDNHLHGHSDGDAVCHALTDAVLGAAGEGDIGEMYSDTDLANAGRDSVEMLREVVARVKKKGFAVMQVDVTIIAESPRMTDHKEGMRA